MNTILNDDQWNPKKATRKQKLQRKEGSCILLKNFFLKPTQ